jgi:hypothetical protein
MEAEERMQTEDYQTVLSFIGDRQTADWVAIER